MAHEHNVLEASAQRISSIHVIVELQYDVLRVITKVLTKEGHTPNESGIILDPDPYTDKAVILYAQGINSQICDTLVVEECPMGVDLPAGEQPILVQRLRPPGRVELPFPTAQVTRARPRPYFNVVYPYGDITRPVITIEGGFRTRLEGEVELFGNPAVYNGVGESVFDKALIEPKQLRSCPVGIVEAARLIVGCISQFTKLPMGMLNTIECSLFSCI